MEDLPHHLEGPKVLRAPQASRGLVEVAHAEDPALARRVRRHQHWPQVIQKYCAPLVLDSIQATDHHSLAPLLLPEDFADGQAQVQVIHCGVPQA